MKRRVCPTCGRALFEPNPTTPTLNDPYLLPDLPTRFRLPCGTAVELVHIIDDDQSATSTIIVKALLM